MKPKSSSKGGGRRKATVGFTVTVRANGSGGRTYRLSSPTGRSQYWLSTAIHPETGEELVEAGCDMPAPRTEFARSDLDFLRSLIPSLEVATGRRTTVQTREAIARASWSACTCMLVATGRYAAEILADSNKRRRRAKGGKVKAARAQQRMEKAKKAFKASAELQKLKVESAAQDIAKKYKLPPQAVRAAITIWRKELGIARRSADRIESVT